MTSMQIAHQIREIRRAKNLSHQELADRSGTSQVIIREIERGQTIPSITILRLIMEAFGGDLIITILKPVECLTEHDALKISAILRLQEYSSVRKRVRFLR